MLEQEIWNLIRETRSARPGQAASDPKRAAVYGAALQQFEELGVSPRSLGALDHLVQRGDRHLMQVKRDGRGGVICDAV